jgi:rSAM/selenodomain-associated transferase 1
MDRAAALQAAFVLDELRMLREAGADTTLCCEPSVPLERYRRLFGPGPDYECQHGADLGDRMLNALHAALDRGERRVVLIGSDLPDLPPEQIRAAFDALEANRLCIGPAPDGGFHLLGLSAPLPADIFRGVVWGGPDVLQRFLDNAEALAPFLLAPWPDVDTLEDLHGYTRRNLHRETHTMERIRTFNLAPETWKN